MIINKSDLPEPVLDAGVLAGLLMANGDAVTVNLDWFKNPFASGLPSLATIGTRLDSLVAVVNSVLPRAATNPPVEGGGQWFAMPDSDSSNAFPFYIVAPAGAASSGQLGVGAQYTLTSDNVLITLFAYVPLLNYSPQGAQFILASDTIPSQIGLQASTVDKKGFTTQGVSFTSLEVSANIYINPSVYQQSTVPPLFNMTFAGLTGTSKPSTYTTLSSLLDPDVDDWIGEVIVQASSWLDIIIGDTSASVGGVLVAAGFLTTDTNGNYQFSLDEIEGLTAEQVALKFLFGTVSALSGAALPCPAVELPGGGLYFVSRANKDATTDYGLRLAIDIPLSSANSDGTGQASPAVDLSLGAWFTGENESDNWLLRSLGAQPDSIEPGLEFYLIRVDQQLNIAFAPNFALSSVGLNISGGNNTPLLNLDGFTLNGAELRFYLDSFSGWTFGGAAMLDGLGIPLGPSFGTVVQSTSTNPVAQSLVGSGSGSGGGNQSAVNPAFSISAGYVENAALTVQLYDKNNVPSKQVTLPLQRGLGPILCQSLGIGWVEDATTPANDQLSLQMNGSVSLGPLNISLVDLSIGIPAGTPGDFSRYDLDLSGMGIVFSAGSVELSAALVKLLPDPKATPPRAYTEYDGEALIKAGTFAITAVGSYAYVASSGGGAGYTSLFIFAVLDADLGGPEFFFVTGLAAGFGYNRSLLLPDQSSVPTFPLVAAASDPTVLGARQNNDGTWQMPDPATALAKLDQDVPPERGEYWLAAGVRFTSFDLINSTALLIVEFGNELEIALLGTSWISLPPPPAPGASAPSIRYAYGELGIAVKVLPSQGVFTATAILTPNSFVIDPACKLTGGFAFYVWFGTSPYAGQFVLTLGGYHPDFTPPSYFPSVPRLGFNWPIGGDLTISGDAYFALTPSAVMTGGGLSIIYSAGNLKAWFIAQMDALIQWAPFHYQLYIGVSIGASYRVHLLFVSFTLKVELGAQLTVWGPPMGGSVHISFYVISVTINFGAPQSASPSPLNWIDDNGAGFAQTLLPHADTSQKTAVLAATGQSSSDVQPSGICVITATAGLLSTFTSNAQTIWIVRPDAFTFSLATAIPTTEIDIANGVGGNTVVTPQSAGSNAYTLYVRPMRATLESSTLQVSVQNDDDNVGLDLASHFDYSPILQPVPAAKWGVPVAVGADPEFNSLLAARLLGLTTITAKAPLLTPSGVGLLDISISQGFTYDTVDDEVPYTPNHLPLSPTASPTNTPPGLDPAILQDIQNTLMETNVASTRAAVFTALQTMGVDAATNGSLAILAADPGAWLTGDPLLASTS